MRTPDWQVWPGVPYPLGATPDAKGVNFAIYSERAEGIDLCLFDPEEPAREIGRLPLVDTTNHVWHSYIPGLTPGALYGLRARGPYEPRAGLRFNHHKLLIDPYARAFSGKLDWSGPVHGYQRDGSPVIAAESHLTFDTRDDANSVPRCVVVSDDFDWGDDRPPGHIWRRTIVYELHVRGFTMRHPDVPPHLRGTYAGLSHPAVIEYLLKLGVTSIELLPVHEVLDEGFLLERGLTNYWGYNTLGFFAPEQRYASTGTRGQQVQEFKEMVKTLHRAGIEVLLDVVFNHAAEGSELGPTVSFRGLDNTTYYWLQRDDPSRYDNPTGCGNALNAGHPQVTKLITDSLRYWVTQMHVDGFRFDLTTTLGRHSRSAAYDRDAPLFQAIHQDPVLSRVKLIAEPWDMGFDGHKLANMPLAWAEWNDRYRDTVRRFWRGDESQASEIGYRLTGSSDLFKLSGRRPTASINFVTTHDGKTLRDLVTFNAKYNEANGDQNRDGTDNDHSWNCGVEGETDDPAINALRQRQGRNLLATLLLSQGTPMLLAGDELGRTQKGNNNAYCQDNEMSWVNWHLDADAQALLAFTRQVIALRLSQPVLTRRHFFLGATIGDSRFRDLVWFRPDGAEMTPADWGAPVRRSLGYLLGGDAIPSLGPQGQRIAGDTLLVLLNADHHSVVFTLPGSEWGATWNLVLDTARLEAPPDAKASGEQVELVARSLAVLRHAN